LSRIANVFFAFVLILFPLASMLSFFLIDRMYNLPL
jgi:hypothetical protein